MIKKYVAKEDLFPEAIGIINVPVHLVSDFEKAKQRYFDVRERKLFFMNTDGSMAEVFDMWFFECFGVEK